MKILVNLATLKKGGGQNVGLNFLKSLKEKEHELSNYHFVVARNSEIEKFLNTNGFTSYTIVSQNPLRRMFFERFRGGALLRKHKIEIIYTIFGIGLYPNRFKQVSGSADSNIFFPEVDFWGDYKGIERFKKSIVDKYRINALKRATAVIFENESMMIRSKKLYKLKHTVYIKPSINVKFKNDILELNTLEFSKKGLFFCGWQKNKNYEIIPLLAQEIKNRKIDFQFFITAPNDHSEEHKKFEENLEKFGVKDMVNIIGEVKKNEIASLYNQIDFVFLLSKLESFSNNIIESWHFKRPLVLADEEWSRSICKNAAKYINRNDVKMIADAVEYLIDNKKEYARLTASGTKELSMYPTISEKTNQELDYIKSIYGKN